MQPSFRPAKTNAPEAKTKAPETKTKAPETKTNAPEAKTNAPEAMTNAPEAKTNAPETNTKALGCAAWCYNRANRRPLCLEGACQPGATGLTHGASETAWYTTRAYCPEAVSSSRTS
jgi:hypothetical protein